MTKIKQKFSQAKFLIVDDLDENLLALEALLQSDNIEIIKARSGVEALEMLLEHEFALALLDVQMPDMDGFELAELMRGTERTRTIPIIFLTAGSSDQQRRFRGYDAGAVDFLTKPIDAHILQSKAQIFLELWLERQEVARQRDELKKVSMALKEEHDRKDEFLATLAHELRNPLAPIGNGLRVIKQAGDDIHTIAHVRNMMERQHQHLTRLVDDLLDISRITSGKIRLKHEYSELKNIISASLEATHSAIEAENHTLYVQLPEEPLWLHVDSVRISQIISNLLTNAARYTPKGGKITLTARQLSDQIEIQVSDTGIGLEEQMVPRIFELFGQVSMDSAKSNRGLGIGLALVKKLVELHEGSIEVTSRGLGLGSAFTVKLPLPNQAQCQNESASTQETTPLEQFHILIVDDNADSAETLSLSLSYDGHQTQTAFDGLQALEVAKEFTPDIIFLDIGLPHMDGYEVARRLRSQPMHQHTTLIALTGWGTEKDRQLSKEAGFDFHLTKPVSNSDIETILRKISQERSSV